MYWLLFSFPFLSALLLLPPTSVFGWLLSVAVCLFLPLRLFRVSCASSLSFRFHPVFLFFLFLSQLIHTLSFLHTAHTRSRAVHTFIPLHPSSHPTLQTRHPSTPVATLTRCLFLFVRDLPFLVCHFFLWFFAHVSLWCKRLSLCFLAFPPRRPFLVRAICKKSLELISSPPGSSSSSSSKQRLPLSSNQTQYTKQCRYQ